MTVVTHSVPAGAEVAMLDGANQIIAAIDLGATALYAKVLRGVLRRRFLIKGLWRTDPLLEGAAR